jgi:hypothetical protein
VLQHEMEDAGVGGGERDPEDGRGQRCGTDEIFEPQAWVSEWAPPAGLQARSFAGPGGRRSQRQSQAPHSVAGSIRRAQARWRHRRA